MSGHRDSLDAAQEQQDVRIDAAELVGYFPEGDRLWHLVAVKREDEQGA